jgi:hypothetical protein
MHKTYSTTFTVAMFVKGSWHEGITDAVIEIVDKDTSETIALGEFLGTVQERFCKAFLPEVRGYADRT